jgi:SAM-dependent methyltransferase
MPPEVGGVLRRAVRRLVPAVGRANEATREQWLKENLERIPGGSRILDAGAGTQRYRRFCEHLRYVSQDVAQYDGKGDEAGLQTGTFDFGKLDIVCDITDVPEPDGSFDAIMCIEVLEHLPDPGAAVREFARLLRPGGHLIVTSPFCSVTHFAPYHYCSGFSRYWYQTHLTGSGFDSLEISPNGNFFEFVAQEVYRLPSVARRYARRGPGPVTYLGMYLLLRALRRFSSIDSGSSELLCFGYNVAARRRDPAMLAERAAS